MRHAENDRHLTLRLPTEHVERLRQIAESQDRAVSDLLRELIAVAIEPGFFEAPEAPPQPVKTADNPFVRLARQRSQLPA